MVNNAFQDYADRWYKFFGGRKHFGYLTKIAKEYGVDLCDRIANEIKRESNIESAARIKLFNKLIHR